MTQVRRMWGWLGTPASQKVIALLMVVYLGALGALTYGQNRIVACQAQYAEKSARSSQARADIAAQDRELDNRERKLDDADRGTLAQTEAALDVVLTALAADDQAKVDDAFRELLKVRSEATKQRQQSAQQRAEIARTRAELERQRARSPIPAPPSSRC